MNGTCHCGHEYDEHDGGDFLEPCEVEGCDCPAYEENLDDEAALDYLAEGELDA
jgi:hypothetical protein